MFNLNKYTEKLYSPNMVRTALYTPKSKDIYTHTSQKMSSGLINRPQSIVFVVDMFIGGMYYEELDAATAARRGLGTVPSRNPFL